MRVLLLSFDPSGHYSVVALGPLYLAAALRRAGHDVRLQLVAGQRSWAALSATLRDYRPEVVGLSAHSCDMPLAEASAQRVRREAPGALTILGGAHASSIEGRQGVGPDIDIVFKGEAEHALPEQLAALHAATQRPAVLGPHRVENLDALAFPAWELAPPAALRGAPQGFFFRHHPWASLSSSRGCPHRCAFCAGPVIAGHTLRLRSEDSVLEEVRWLTRRFGVRELHIVDDAFATRRDRALRLLARLAPLGLSLSFPNGLRIDRLDDELLRAMREAGVFFMNLGIESGSQRVLDAMGKGTRLDAIADTVQRVVAHGIDCGAFFLLGFPGESPAERAMSIDFACRLPLHFAHFGLYLPLPGTSAAGGSALAPGALAYYAASRDRALRADLRRAYLRFYARPRVALGLARRLRSPRHFGFALARAAAYLG